MNRTPKVELVLSEYLAEDGGRAPDYILDAVADRLDRQRQRRSWPFQGRTTMSQLKLAVALAAAVIIAVVGYNLLPRQPSVGGAPTPSPTTNPSPPRPSPTLASGQLPDGRLAAGHYTMTPIPELASLKVAADIPSGWQGYPDIPALISPGAQNNTGVLIGFTKTDGLFSNACHWDVDGTQSALHGDVVVGPTVENLVAALKANTSYTSSAATPVTVGGFAGQEIELQLPGADVIRSCDRRPAESTGDYFVFPNGFYAQAPNSRWHLYIVDVAGTRLITMLSEPQGIPQADITAAEAIVESFVVTP
jgi:hypothetical protein